MCSAGLLTPRIGGPNYLAPQVDSPGRIRASRAAPSPSPRRKKKQEEDKDWHKAAEKPPGNTKAETDMCLTCIDYGRSCVGTEMVWIHGEYRCKLCATKGTSTGTRKCLWKDVAKNVFTYQEARTAADLKSLPANTAEGVAQRKARREAQANQTSMEKEKVESEEGTQAKDEEDSEEVFEAKIAKVWQALLDNTVSASEEDDNDDAGRVTVYTIMKIFLQDVVQEKPEQWPSDVVEAVAARLDAHIGRAQAAVDRAVASAFGPNQRVNETRDVSIEEDDGSASETGYDAEDDPASDDSTMLGDGDAGEVAS